MEYSVYAVRRNEGVQTGKSAKYLDAQIQLGKKATPFAEVADHVFGKIQ